MQSTIPAAISPKENGPGKRGRFDSQDHVRAQLPSGASSDEGVPPAVSEA